MFNFQLQELCLGSLVPMVLASKEPGHLELGVQLKYLVRLLAYSVRLQCCPMQDYMLPDLR